MLIIFDAGLAFKTMDTADKVQSEDLMFRFLVVPPGSASYSVLCIDEKVSGHPCINKMLLFSLIIGITAIFN